MKYKCKKKPFKKSKKMLFQTAELVTNVGLAGFTVQTAKGLM